MSIGLIVPDVHEQITTLERVLDKYDSQVAWVVFLGDFMDSFHGLTQETRDTILWLAENIQNPKYTFLWGNHDIHYAFPVEGLMCSGHDPHKQWLVNEHLTDDEHWKKFRLMYWIEDGGNEWLCSHAGIHPTLLHPTKGYDPDALLEMEENAMYSLRYCQTVPSLVAAGRGRGGPARVGGVDWLDWNMEFQPIEGLNQIVGHTFGKTIRTKNTSGSTNYCIDTHLKHVLLMEDGKVKVEEV